MSKRAARGALESEDIGIALHAIQSWDSTTSQVVISATPVLYESLAADDLDCSALATVLSLRTLPLPALLSLRAWELQEELLLSMPQVDGHMPLATSLVYADLMHRLVSTRGGLGINAADSSDPWLTSELLRQLAENRWVESAHVAGQDRWSLTSLGTARVQLGLKVHSWMPLMELRDDVPHAEMSKFELLTILDRASFTCKCAASKSDKAHARRSPYTDGKGERIFWILAGWSYSDLQRNYLILLITAGDHKKAVPHLSSSPTYAKLLDPDWRPKKRARKEQVLVLVGDDDVWDVPTEEAPAGRAAKARSKKIAKRRPEAWESECSDLSRTSCRSSSKSSTSSSSSSSDGSDSSGTSSAASACSGKAPAPKAPASPLRRVNTKSAPVPPVPVPPAAPVPPARRPTRHSVVSTKDVTNREQFGKSFLTVRWSLTGLDGYQMTCTNPRHQGGTHKCTMEKSVKMAGSVTALRQLLKSWLLMGQGLATRDEHCSAPVKDALLAACRGGQLMSEEMLDTLAIVDWDAEVDVTMSEAAVVGGKVAAGPDILGGANAGVPAAVHAEMVTMAESGYLPKTTPKQRQRNLPTSCAAPEMFADALRYSYVHPNLPAPRGFGWRAGGGKFRLSPLGG